MNISGAWIKKYVKTISNIPMYRLSESIDSDKAYETDLNEQIIQDIELGEHFLPFKIIIPDKGTLDARTYLDEISDRLIKMSNEAAFIQEAVRRRIIDQLRVDNDGKNAIYNSGMSEHELQDKVLTHKGMGEIYKLYERIRKIKFDLAEIEVELREYEIHPK